MENKNDNSAIGWTKIDPNIYPVTDVIAINEENPNEWVTGKLVTPRGHKRGTTVCCMSSLIG